MRSSKVAFPLILLVLVPFIAFGQSLGGVAKKERERREKNKQQGVVAREFSEEDVFREDAEGGASDGEGESEGEGEGEDEDEAPPAETPGSTRVPDRIDVSVEGAVEPEENLEKESRERRRSEAEWRSRMQDARDRVAAARERVDFLSGLSLAQGERYVDSQGNTVIQSLDHLRRLVREAQEELQSAEASLRQTQEEARRAGVPPGWLR